jgi:hypothetical protein
MSFSPMTSQVREFPLAVFGGGGVVHYVDDYHWMPGRTLCGRGVENVREDRALKAGERLCLRCARSEWPTRGEWEAYGRCTDCGVDCRALGEMAYGARERVWGQAYPGYNEKGIGVGVSRPCIGCLELRLKRLLNRTDFTSDEINSPHPDRHSLRLMARLRREPSMSGSA